MLCLSFFLVHLRAFFSSVFAYLYGWWGVRFEGISVANNTNSACKMNASA